MLTSMEVRSGRPGRCRSVANGRDLAFHDVGVAPVGLAARSPYGTQRPCGIHQELQPVALRRILAAEHREHRRQLDIVGAAGGSSGTVSDRDRDDDDIATVSRQVRQALRRIVARDDEMRDAAAQAVARHRRTVGTGGGEIRRPVADIGHLAARATEAGSIA